MIGALIRGGAT